MMNKLLIALTIITLASSMSYFVSTYLKKESYPKSTGAEVYQVVPKQYYSEVEAMEKLGNSLPLTNSNFSITFDFKRGKYIVSPISSQNLLKDFNHWYTSSEFTAIPISRFLILDN